MHGTFFSDVGLVACVARLSPHLLALGSLVAALSPSSLPKLESLISGDEICKRFGFSRQTLRRLVRAKKFPQPVKLSSTRLAWRLKEVEAWVAAGGLDQFK